ncbi:uncharacterized protein LOC124165693 [Ischnura elegans]|uniref:uncharacterized protein LOC124165693 n=1 Tax=Ischnura elegans TaxID=197161 RepID=UPI001ED8736F|nr:uncharacterized protein LOC124165693 [Ischnura elegans]
MNKFFALTLTLFLISSAAAYPKIRVARQVSRGPARIPQPVHSEVKSLGRAIEGETELDYGSENSLSDDGEEVDAPTYGNSIEEQMGLPSNATSIRVDISNNFQCEGRNYGFYADVDNDCQLFHVCLPVQMQDGNEFTLKWSFICPGETIFNQETFTCARMEDSVACADAPQFYRLNDNFGQAVTTERDIEDASESPSEFGDPEAVEVEAADEDDTIEVSTMEGKRPLIQQYLRRQPPLKFGHRH